MDLPTPRELELETLLRQRDVQLADLTDEVTHLRQYLANQPVPTVTDPISLPPPLVSLLLPHINDRSAATSSSAPSSTVTQALTQRVKVLQEENDELYELLKTGETGRLKEDVRSLKRVVQKLEGALRDSHQVINSLSEELDKAQATILDSSRTKGYPGNPRNSSQSPAIRTNQNLSPHANQTPNGSSKLPPTGPRAHKKPRLSETPSAPPSSHGTQPAKGNRVHGGPSARRQETPDRSPRMSSSNDRKVKMEVDDEERKPWSPKRGHDHEQDRVERPADRDRDRERDHERERDRPQKDRVRDRHTHRDRDRDRDRTRDFDRSKRNGAYGGGGGGGSSGGGGGGGRRPRRGSNANSYSSAADRTLKERMGL
ncbi:WTAP/Mum2p family protein [Phanerochaete sordida]|uniref:WTAP/Mum2p family protein n=1 Tax=Phanerochaete sordida TaxID=48140 RepID=A0A9P3FXL7_9APHY|nr:WTAP/Mum2p family protein [Phanerochaete sordida]